MLGKTVNDKEGARIVLFPAAAGEDTAVAELENDGFAIGLFVQLRRKRPHARVLVGEREPRLPLVRRNKVEALELEDITPAAGDLTVGNAEDTGGNGAGHHRDGAPVEDAVPKITEHDRFCLHLLNLSGELLRLPVGYAAVVERVHLQQAA